MEIGTFTGLSALCIADGLTDDGARALRDAAPGHVTAVRRLFLDVVTPEQLAAIGAAAASVLERLDTDGGPDGVRPDR
jgi:predicted O-methyltransferase YrrM